MCVTHAINVNLVYFFVLKYTQIMQDFSAHICTSGVGDDDLTERAISSVFVNGTRLFEIHIEAKDTRANIGLIRDC